MEFLKCRWFTMGNIVCRFMTLFGFCLCMFTISYYYTISSHNNSVTFHDYNDTRDIVYHPVILVGTELPVTTVGYPVTTVGYPSTVTPTVTDQNPSNGYVTFVGGFKDGRGLGNQMFNLAAVVYVAEMTGRRPVMERVNFEQGLDQVFNLSQIERFDDVCPCYNFGESKALSYDERIEQFAKIPHESTGIRTITLGGFFQSWKYTRITSQSILSYFRFKTDVSEFAQKYLKSVHPPGWMRQGYTRVAIHIRRGDVLTQHSMNFGYTTPDANYFHRAMNYFIQHYKRVQFIAISQDKDWTTKNILVQNSTDQTYMANVTYAFDNSHAHDMAIMAACDHVIMSSGTFGWWGAWLAKGTTIYYSNWPKNQSSLASLFVREDFFPPSWIPM